MTRLWHQLVTNSLLVAHLFEFMKLIELAIIQNVGTVEDERTFSTLFFYNVQVVKLFGRAFEHCHTHVSTTLFHQGNFSFLPCHYKLE
jgi:hypothetical protein